MYKKEYLLAKNGEETIKINDVFLHSAFNPSGEAEKYISKQYKKADIQILIGYGNGYLYKALQTKITTNERIIVIEPTNIIENEQIDFNVNGENFLDLEFFLKNEIDILTDFNIIISVNYDKLFVEEIKKILERIKQNSLSNHLIENTFNNYTDSWHENYIKNLKYSKTDFSCHHLKGLYSQPVIVVSSGPSLTKQIPLLKKYRDSYILICAGSTINALLAHNIIPNYVASIDGRIYNSAHFNSIQTLNVPLLYTPTNHYEVRSKFQKGYYFLHQFEHQYYDHFSTYTEEDVSYFIGGGSVANVAFEIGLMMTTGPVALVGQDLAFTNMSSHAEGSKHKSEVDEAFIINNNLIEVKDYSGAKTYTMQAFLQFKNSFSEIVQTYSLKDRVYNCTEGGLAIENIKNVALEDFLTKYVNESPLLMEVKPTIAKKKSLASAIKIDLKQLRKLKEKLVESKELIDKYNQGIKINRIDKNDEMIMKLIKQLGLERPLSKIFLKVHREIKLLNSQSVESSKSSYLQLLMINKEMYINILDFVNKTEVYYKGVLQEEEKKNDK